MLRITPIPLLLKFINHIFLLADGLFVQLLMYLLLKKEVYSMLKWMMQNTLTLIIHCLLQVIIKLQKGKRSPHHNGLLRLCGHHYG